MALNKDECATAPNITYPMLDYEKQIFMDVYENDGLVILAKGLNYDKIVSNLLWVYKAATNLVLVVNCSEHEEKYLTHKLDLKPLPLTAPDREKCYLSGGICVMSTRVLVVDILRGRLPVERVTGVVVLRAHTLLESCQEAFALRLYREANKSGFVKGFSNSPVSFTFGFHQVEKVMRTMFVTQLYLWPRFHGKVIESLRGSMASVTELRVALSGNMRHIQSALLDIINYTIKQLKAANKCVDLQEATLDNCMSKQFHKILQSQLDAVWYQLGTRTKEYVQDLKVLRAIGLCMLHNDAVTLYSMVSEYRTREYAQMSSGWVLLDAAEQLFQAVKSRVYNNKNEFDPEPCPKWKCLTDLLTKEIIDEVAERGGRIGDTKVLVLCQDTRTCHQLNEILTMGPNRYLLHRAMTQQVAVTSLADTTEQTEHTEEQQMECSSYVLTQHDDTFVNITQQDDMATPQHHGPLITIQTFKECGDPFSLGRSITHMTPDYVVLYHCDVFAIRVLEATVCGMGVVPRVYLMLHDNSVEEQTYLTALRREKLAFEHLIRTKSEMVVPAYQDGKTDEAFMLNVEWRDDDDGDSRKGGGAVTTAAAGTVVVDTREFRSELPALLHRRRLRVVPLTIAVGDYVLSPDICAERKSISDLASSLTSGRLHSQCTNLCRNYRTPILLIEFNDAFRLQSNAWWSVELQQKLQLLTMHFPMLKLVWSPSPYATAELFAELKMNRADPDVSALRAQTQQTHDIEQQHEAHDLLRKLPGVTARNVHALLRRGRSLAHLCTLTQEQLGDVMECPAGGKQLYKALHDTLRKKAAGDEGTNKRTRKFPNKK